MDTIHCYFVHRHLNNAWYNKAHSIIWKEYLAISEPKCPHAVNDQLDLRESSTPYNPLLVSNSARATIWLSRNCLFECINSLQCYELTRRFSHLLLYPGFTIDLCYVPLVWTSDGLLTIFIFRIRFFNPYRLTVRLLHETLPYLPSFTVKGPWNSSRVVADQFVSLH